jgi:hypothetical protein
MQPLVKTATYIRPRAPYLSRSAGSTTKALYVNAARVGYRVQVTVVVVPPMIVTVSI